MLNRIGPIHSGIFEQLVSKKIRDSGAEPHAANENSRGSS